MKTVNSPGWAGRGEGVVLGLEVAGGAAFAGAVAGGKAALDGVAACATFTAGCCGDAWGGSSEVEAADVGLVTSAVEVDGGGEGRCSRLR